MKTTSSFSSHQFSRIRSKAFTLTEMMISMSILMVVVLGVTYAHITGLKMYEATKAKLGANDMARDAINNLISEVRTCTSTEVGFGDLTSFTPINVGLHKGNAIQIYLTDNKSNYIRYFKDTNSAVSNPTADKLLRTTNSVAYREIIAEYITNNNVFTHEDFRGNIISNNQSKAIVGMLLSFYQIQYPVIVIGGRVQGGQVGSYFDYYQLSTKITPRCP